MSNDKGGMVSLVNYLGDERIKFQVVHNSVEGKITMNKAGTETKFTMVTESVNIKPADFVGAKRKKIGLLVWVDVDDYESWVASK